MSKVNPLKAWREKAGLSQPALAAKLGVSVQSVRQWEWGGMDPSLPNLEKLAETMGLPTEKLGKAWNAWKEGLEG